MRLGLAPDGHCALPAPGAERAFLCLFDGEAEVARHELAGRTGEVLHGRVPPPAPGSSAAAGARDQPAVFL